MNERIKKLMRQACKESFRPESVLEDVPQDVLEKFAQLIIADAINTVERRFMGDLNREDMEVRRCVEALKAHFGVEK